MFENLPKPDVILTHESDLDGLVAGVLLQRLAAKLYGSTPPLEACNYNYWRQRDIREKAVWVTDMTFEARLDKPGYIIVDHHVTDVVPKQAVLVHDVAKSASLLAYELCVANGIKSPELDRLVHLSNVNDLFLQDHPDFELASDYGNLVKIYQFWNLHALVDGQIEKLLDHPLLEVMAVKRRIEDPLGLAWSRKNVVELAPKVGFVDTVVGNNNRIVHLLLEEGATPYPVLVTMFRRANGVVIASFRSRNGDAIKVAEKLQGGGHANASGATLPRAVKNIPDAIQYLRNVLAPPPPPEAAKGGSVADLFDAIEAREHGR